MLNHQLCRFWVIFSQNPRTDSTSIANFAQYSIMPSDSLSFTDPIGLNASTFTYKLPRVPATRVRGPTARRAARVLARGATPHCVAHGGGYRCVVPGCTKGARGSTGRCKGHGGGRRCGHPGCTKSAQTRGLCIAHGKLRKAAAAAAGTAATGPAAGVAGDSVVAPQMRTVDSLICPLPSR